MISIVLPVFNEIQHGYLPKIVESLSEVRAVELLAVDGGSTDETKDYLKSQGFQVFLLPESSRAARLRKGLELATGDVIVFHHPRSFLEPMAWQWLSHQYDRKSWGGFTHRFDTHHWLLRFTSWYSNNVRSRRGILYLDHCLFFPKSAIYDPREIPDVEIFEDTEVSKILSARLGAPHVVDFVSTTSAVRFQANGVFRQAFLNQKMKIQYYMGQSDYKMNVDYEKNLGLNNRHL